MLLEAMYHVPRDKWAYAYDTETIHLRVRTKRDDVDYVVALTGDKYDWQHTSYDIIMEKAASDDKFDYWEAAVRPKYKRLSYTFRVSKGMETVYLLDNGIRSECRPRRITSTNSPISTGSTCSGFLPGRRMRCSTRS